MWININFFIVMQQMITILCFKYLFKILNPFTFLIHSMHLGYNMTVKSSW